MCKGWFGEAYAYTSFEKQDESLLLRQRQLGQVLAVVSGRVAACSFASLEPGQPQAASGMDLVDCVAQALLCTMSADTGRRAGSRAFDSTSIPTLPLSIYLQRLYREFECSDSTLVCALVLLDRLLGFDCAAPRATSATAAADGDEGRIVLTPWNAHRLFFNCAVLAAKFNEDLTLTNQVYARVGGIKVAELNRDEKSLFQKLGYQLNVHPAEYDLYRRCISPLANPAVPVPEDPFERRLEAPTIDLGVLASTILMPCCGDTLNGLALLVRSLTSEVDLRLRDKTRTS